LTKYQIQAIGTKAAQLSRIARLELPHNNNLPLQWSFVIPFSTYKQHVSESCGQELQAVMDAYKGGKNPNEALATLRAAIESRPIQDKSVVDTIAALLQAWKAAGVFDKAAGAIFRSSTNVEDLPGFNGAGLYLSEPVKYPACLEKEKIELVLKQVWASLWNSRGFVERQEFGLKQDEVFMAVIVMPFLDAFANGVAITGNPFRADFNAYFINTQVAGKYATSEQLLF
jgi:rifampicin phosphotransferase